MGDRRLKDEERTLYAPFRASDRDSLRLAWVKPRSRRDGNEPEGGGEPESVKITPADPYCAGMATPGLVRVETLRELFDNFTSHPDFRNAPIPNPQRRVLHVWQARFQPPASKKSARDMVCCSPRQYRHIPSCESIRSYQMLSNARNPPPRISETHPSPTREGGFCMFGRRGFQPPASKKSARERDCRLLQYRHIPRRINSRL